MNYGFINTNTNPANVNEITLSCDSQYEASIYNAAPLLTTFDSDLKRVNIPITIMAGKNAWLQPSFLATFIARRLPQAEFIRWNDAGHFGPFEKPVELANIIHNKWK